ncbi:MAG: hypothetical protein Q8Q65_01685 [bacterium]|nr:hypothetical protein [bacterium]
MFNQKGFASPILIWIAVGLIAIVAVSKTGSENKKLPETLNNQTFDQQSTKPTIQPNPTVEPQVLTDKVKQYYSDISNKHFNQAWSLLSKNFQNYSKNYDSFVNGYNTTKSILVQDVTLKDLATNTVFIKLQSTDNINNQIQTKNYSGTWKLIFEDGSWKLDTANIILIGISPAPKTCQFNKEQLRTVLKEYGYTDEEINQFFIIKPGDCFNLKLNNNQPQVYYDDPTSDQSDESSYNSNNPQTTPTSQNTSYNDDSESNKSLKYNPYNSTWEYARDDESLKYNAFEDQWEYASNDETTKYNAFEDKWEYADENESTKYNAFENTWEYAEDDSTTKYNPYESKWEITNPGSTLKYNYFERTWGYE